MKRENKEKGFSLVELLAVVVILGLLSTIAIIGVNAIIKNAEKKYYETQKNTLTMAAQSYAQDNRNSLPKTIGSSTEITLKTLQDKKYVDEIKNRQGATCDATKSYVRVFKYSKDGYNYTSYLVCPGYENEAENTENAGPTIKLEYKDSGKYTNKNDTIEIASYKSPKVIINIERKNDGENKGKNILSYNYVIYRCTTNAKNEEVCTTEIKNSGSVEAHQQAKITEEFSVKEYLSNKIKIVVSSVDEYGNTTTLTKYLKLGFKDGPQCELISDSNVPWINDPSVEMFREVKVKCIDTNGSGCEKEIYSQIFTGETYKGTITIKDNSGKETLCEVDIKIDTTAPATPKLTNPYDNKWTNKDYNVTAESSDATSGVEKFQYRYPNSKDPEEQNWKDFSKKNKDKIQIPQTKERSEILEVRACDAAGNCSEAAKTTIKLDKTAPTCKVTKSIANPNGPNNWYISKVDVNLTTGNPTSGAVTAVASNVSYGLSTTNTATYNSKAKYTQGDTKSVTYYGFVKDEAGNTSTCKSSSIKVDITAPTTPKLTNPYDNKWTNKDYNVTAESSDATSGVEKFQYRYPNSKNPEEQNWKDFSEKNKDKIQISQTKERSEILEVRACDAVGNCSEAAKTTIKLDKTAPTCKVTKSIANPNGPNNWYISKVDVNLTTENPTSGAVTAVASNVSYGFSTTNTATYNSKTKYTQGDTTGVTYYGFVKDEAGNTSTCKSSSIKVDTTAPTTPTITNANNNKWVNFNYDVTVKSTDATSGIAYFEYRNSNTETAWHKHTDTEKDTVKISYKNDGEYKLEVRACDKGGNCSSSATTTIKIDKVAPTCSISKDDIGSQSGVSATVNCYDDRSGCPQTSTTYSEITSSESYYVTDAAGNKSTACSIDVSSYSCNPYQAVCGSKKCGATCLTYADNANANCYACGLASNCCRCAYKYCYVYCTYWNTCYE